MPAKPSPFPGMDPYLESEWGTIHSRIIGNAADDLATLLADDLAARTEARIVIDGPEGGERPDHRPDVAIVGPALDPWTAARPVTGGAALAEPVLLANPGPITDRWIDIVDLSGKRVVTSIEFLSPRNKLAVGGGRAAYLRKRRDVLSSHTNLVEIDLVRAGNWLSLLHPFTVPRRDRTAYRATVARSEPIGGPLALYPIRLDERLPVIRIPLRAGEPDATLDLQSLVERIYRNGRYDGIDYAQPCDPPLTGDEAAWADELLRAAGRR